MKGSNYYGSDLNRFIDESCSHKMTCINIDCFLVKVSKKRIRFIESKHTKEGMKKGQKTALKLLSEMLHPSYTVETFVVRGDYPYNTATVENIETGERTQLDQDTLIAWLDFEVELEQVLELVKEYTPLSEVI